MKRKIIANIDLNEFKKLTFNVKDAHSLLIWHHNKEFEYKNVMYDIVRKEVQGQFITFWCWKDVKETKLNKMLVTLVNTKLNTEPN